MVKKLFSDPWEKIVVISVFVFGVLSSDIVFHLALAVILGWGME